VGSIVNLDSTGAERQRLRRTIAEALNRLMAKRTLDDEARDLSALIVLSLRRMDEGVSRSAAVWERRGYYVKADRLRTDWEWAARSADRMTVLIRGGDWARLPVVLAGLAPRFADVQVVKLTRSPRTWQGAYDKLMAGKE
jgi:hypothetical protein